MKSLLSGYMSQFCRRTKISGRMRCHASGSRHRQGTPFRNVENAGLFLVLISFLVLPLTSWSQEYFDITNYHVDVQVGKDASLTINEKIAVHFNEPRHGIFRKIPFKYKISALPDGVDSADMDWVRNGYRYTKIKNIKVKNLAHKDYTEGDFRVVRIGSEDKLISGDQVYELSYTIIGAVNFFKDFSELYLNLIGNGWPVAIHRVDFDIHFFKPVADTTQWFITSGGIGARDNITTTKWQNSSTLSGVTNILLNPGEGLTVGVRLPQGYLHKPDYKMMGKGWIALPVLLFFLMYVVWRKWGKDLPVTVVTEYYPPEGVSPSVAGYVIDGKLDRRDLTALIPYWGAGGYLKVEELETKGLFGLTTQHQYKFIKQKELPSDVKEFERVMFNGLFKDGDTVDLGDLKDSFYQTMETSKAALKNEINKNHFYVKYTRTLSGFLPVVGAVILVLGVVNLLASYPLDLLLWSSVIVSSVPVIIFGALMEKKTVKGTALYQQLLGFKAFIRSVEKDRLQEFLKQDANYFDKVLPFAIVFDIADTWKDKLKGLDVPPPSWYSGYLYGNNFSTLGFMNSLDRSLNSMSQTFYSRPSSGGSAGSGGSFGGGGFSGGGFGGGGGGSW